MLKLKSALLLTLCRARVLVLIATYQVIDVISLIYRDKEGVRKRGIKEQIKLRLAVTFLLHFN